MHRQRVLLSQNLLRIASERIPEKNTVAVTATSWWAGLFSSLRMHQLAWVVAALLIAVLGGWFLLRPPSPTITTPEIAKVEPTMQIVSPTPEPQSLKPEPQNSKPTTLKPEPRNLTPVFVLDGAFNINQTRGTGSKNAGSNKAQTLAIEKKVEKVTLQMPLEGERYAKYQAEIRAVDSSKMFIVKITSPLKSAKNISLTIPATRFATADYLLILSGVSSTGEVEEINQYPFRVTCVR